MAVRVLLVDDVRELRVLVRTALRVRGGFDVVGEAVDGAEGVRLAGRLRPDLVVLDLGLPDLAGSELLARVRAASPLSRIVVFSGSQAPEIAERVEGYVLKDAELDYLVDLLEVVAAGGPPAIGIALRPDLRSVAQARAFVRQTLGGWDLARLCDDVQLVVSELVANAITHARSAPELRLALTDAAVRVEVRDDGTGTPDPKPPTASAESGRGMLLVSALSAAWGVELVPDDGKVVWAELPLAA